jgi:hypothetical protein
VIARLGASELCGHWVRLQPLRDAREEEVRLIDAAFSRTPQIGGLLRRRLAKEVPPDAMVIRETQRQEAIGVITALEEEDFPGVYTVSLFVDDARSRAGWALEAFLMFTMNQFELGRDKLAFEVMSFNEPVIRLLRRIGLEPEARLRSHSFIAGRWWDMLVFGLTGDVFQRIVVEHPRWAGPRAALGRSRR